MKHIGNGIKIYTGWNKVGSSVWNNGRHRMEGIVKRNGIKVTQRREWNRKYLQSGIRYTQDGTELEAGKGIMIYTDCNIIGSTGWINGIHRLERFFAWVVNIPTTETSPPSSAL